MKVGEVPKCGCGKTKNPPYCDGSHYEPREAVEAAQPAADPKKRRPLVKQFDLNASDEVKAWNAAIDSLKALKRQQTKNGLR
jgi:hypothetical protein